MRSLAESISTKPLSDPSARENDAFPARPLPTSQKDPVELGPVRQVYGGAGDRRSVAVGL